MKKEFLNLTPKRFLCPYCGEWHEYSDMENLGYYDSSDYEAEFICTNAPPSCNEGSYRFYFSDGYFYYHTDMMCTRASQEITGKIPISSIVENLDAPIVTFDVAFTTEEKVGKRNCHACRYNNYCNFCALGDRGDNRHMTIKFGFEFEQSDYDEISDAVAQEIIDGTTAVEEIKEDTTMANVNIFNLNTEFGPNKDENIISTLMGIAVKNGDSYRIYDKKKKKITDIGNIQIGSLPIFILPSTKLNEGDLIKDDGEYYFVMKSENETNQFLYVKTGELKTVVPIKNILGLSCYSKVIALSDYMDDDKLGVEKIAIMSAMCNQSGNNNDQVNQLIPFMLFKDKLGSNDDMMNMMLMTSMMSVPAEGDHKILGQNTGMNQLLPLLLFKDKLDGDDDMMNKMFMASMMSGGNMAENNNFVMVYFMLDKFLNKNKDEDKSDQCKNKDEDKSDQ